LTGMGEGLSEEELERYSRQIALEEIGYAGQLKLKRAKVCLAGLGGLGVPTAQKLTAMGVGYIRMVDRDIVSSSDLHRQYLYNVSSIGYPKVEVASKKLSELNPGVRFDPMPTSITSNSIHEILQDIDVVVDGLDSIETRYVINRACVKLKVPYVFGAAIESHGNVSTILPRQTVCLECFHPGLEDEVLPKCSVVGVHPSVLSIISSVQVSETVRLLIGKKPNLLNKLLVIDLRSLSFDEVKLVREGRCRVCGDKPEGPPLTLKDKFLEEQCARNGNRTYILTPRKQLAVNFEELLEVLQNEGARIKARGELGITFERGTEGTLSILKSGVAIAQVPPTGTKMDPKRNILETYQRIMVGGLGVQSKLLPDLG